MAAHQAQLEPTRIWYGDYDNKVHIPELYDYRRIVFQLGPNDAYHGIRVGITEHNKLEIQGGHALSIEPVVSNTLLVGFRD